MTDFKTISTYLIKKKLEEEEEKKSTTAQASGTSSSSIGSSSSSSSASSSSSTSSDGTSARKTTQNRSILDATSERVKEKRDAILNRANGEYDETEIPDYIGSGFAALIQKREQEEKQKREARKLAAEQLMQSVGWAKVGNEVVYKTPFSPLPDPNKTFTMPNGKQATMRGNKVLAPGLYGINPDEYVQEMTAIDKYNQKPELSAESKATLNRWFPEKKGQMPTDEELDARGRNIADQFEGEQYGRAVQALKKDYEAVQKALVAYQEPSKATDGVLSDETRDFLQKNFGAKYQRGELPTADEIEAWAETQTFDRDGLEQLYAASDEIQKVQASHDASHEVYDAYAEAIKLLGADAEQYAGQSKSDYYERYGNMYRAGGIADEFKPDYSDKYGLFKSGPSEAEMTTQAVMNKGMYTHVSPELISGAGLAMQNMTDEQRETYLYLASEYGEDTAYDYFQALLSEPKGFNEQAWLARDKALRQKTNEHWFGETLKTFLTAPAQVAGGMYSLGQYMKGEEIDPYHNMFVPGQMTQTPRSETSDMITRNFGTTDENGDPSDTLWSWLLNSAYQAVVSSVDSKIAARLTFGTSPLAGSLMQGTWGAGSAIQDAKLRGGSDEQALVMGALNTVIETATEYIPMERLLESMNSKDIKTVVDILRRGAIGALAEAPGEAASAAAGWITDDIVMGAMSNWDALVKEKGQLGAALQVAGDVFTEGFIGGLSGAGGNIKAASGSYARNKMVEHHEKSEDNLLKEAAEARAEQIRSEQEDQAMLEGLPADMPVQEAEVPEYVNKPAAENADAQHAQENQRAADQEAQENARAARQQEQMSDDLDAQQRNQDAKQQEQMNAEQAAQQRARQQELEQKNDTQAAEMQEKATENASKAARADTASKAQTENAKAANEAKKQDKQRALMQFKQKQEAVAMSRDGMNEPVTVTGVDHVENGTVYMTVTDANGVERVESADDMSFSSDVGELLASDNIDRLDDRGVAAYIDNYNAELATVKQYERAFVGVYERARAGVNYRDAVTNSVLAQNYLTQEAASQAFLAGTARFNMDQVRKQQKRQKFQDPVLNAMNKMAGGKIFMVDSLPGNAMYEESTGNIYIAKDAEKGAYAYYAMHELVHKLKHESPDYWGKFREMVEDELLVHDVDIDAEMAHVMENYKAQGKKLDAEGALEEVIANHAPALLQDRAVLEKMVAKDRTLMEKIREWFEGFMDKLHNAMVESGEAMSDLESWHNIDMLKGDSAQLMKMYDCLAEALESAKGEQSKTDTQDVKLSAREKEYYDYSKPFIEQMRDLQNGKINGRDGLLIGRTPKLLRDIGLSDLPLMINNEHARYLFEGKESSKNDDHIFSWKTIERLPRLIAEPVAVVASNDPKYEKNSVNVIIEATSKNGKQGFAAIYVNGDSYSNRRPVNANVASTVFGNEGTESMLFDAIVQNATGGASLYYINKKKARSLLENASKFSAGVLVRDGLNRTLADPGSKVNTQNVTQTDTKQFKYWFKGSKVVNADGTPKVMYRGGGEDIEVFDRKKSKSSNLYGRGFYFTDSEEHAKQYGDVRSYYLRIKKPLNASSGTKRISEDQMRAFLEAVAEDEDYGLENYGYGASVDSVLKALKGKSDFDALQDVNATAIGDFVAAIELFNEVNGTSYDGIITPTETVVFDSKQIKSATDNVGLFDPDNPNVKFSLRETVEETRDLLAVHNLTEENMRGALELGGLAMPSIAVIKAEQGHSKYGPISAIFDKSTIDPKASSANEIYGGDAWTPTFPQVEYEVDSNAEKRICDKYYELEPKVGNQTARALYRYATDLEEEMNRHGGVDAIIKRLEGNTDMMQMYLADNGLEKPEPVKKTIVKRTHKHQAEHYDSLIQKMGEDVMRSFETPEGEKVGDHRRAWMAEHGEALKQAYVEVMADATGLPEENVAALAENKQNVRRMLMDAFDYMKTGGETREEVTDYEATEKAIRDVVDEKAYKKWLNDLFKGAEKSKGIRNQKDMFTPSGNRRSFSATHWDVTLDNVVRAMRSEEKTGVGSIGGRNIEGAAVKKYSSIKDMKADSDRLQTIDQDEYEAMRKGFRDRFSAIARDYAGDGDWFDAGDVLVEAVTKYQTADGIYKYISKYVNVYKPSKKVADDLHALVEEMKNAPTGYFEAKPRRAIGFDEMAAVIVPDNLSDDVRTALEDAGANMIEYEAGNEADRLAKMNGEAVSNLKFSLREDSAGNLLTQEQQEYFADSKVRDENGRLLVMYHGTANAGHTMFDIYGRSNYGLFGQGAYFTEDPTVAQSYTEKGRTKPGKEKGVYTVYLNITKPMDMDAPADASAWQKAVPYADFPEEGTNENFYRAMEVHFQDMMYTKWEAAEVAMDTIRGMGYDGITHIGGGRYNKADTNRHRVYIAFEPEQIKNIDNKEPTDDPDIRWSLRESDTTVQDELTTLKDLFHLTSAHRMTDKEATRMARKVKAVAQSTMGTEELAGKLKHIYDYVEHGGKNASMEEVDSELNAVAEEIMATSRTLDYEHEERMQPIRDYFRRNNIRLSDYQLSEAANKVGSIGEYRRMVFGRVKLANTGLPLETAWSELSDLDAELFPPDAKETDMPVLLLDAVDAMAPVYLNDSGLNAMEAAQWLTGEMNNAYLSLSGVQAAAKEQKQLAISLKQYRKLTERFATEHKAAFDEAMVKVKADMDEEKRKQMEEAEKQYRLDVLNARADAKAEYKDEIARVKADADAKIAKMKYKLGEAKAKYRDKQNEKYKDWRKEYRTAQSEKYKEFRDAYRKAMQKKDKEWRVQYREDRKETERKQRYRGQITRMMNELVKLLEHPTDKKHVQDGLRDAVLEFCHNIDLGSSSKATQSLQSRITSLVKAMEDARKGTEAGNNQYLIDPDLLDTMKEFAEKVKTLGSMNELTADQMREMRNMVRGVAHIVKTADWMFVANRKMRISDAAQSSMAELNQKKDKKKREGFLGKLDELMNNGMLDSFRAFDRFGTTARKMYQNLRDGFDVKVRCIAQAVDTVQKHLEGVDKDIVKGRKAKKTTYQVRGGEIELTKAQVMELYCLSKREAARKHLYNGGITTDDHVSSVRITEADVQKITSTLTDGERKLAEALQMFLETECSKWGNETSMTLHGYRKFGEKGYYPMRVDDGSVDTKVTESGQSENLWAMVNPGFGKELSDKANQALRIGDIFDTFSRHVDSMSSYRAYAAPIADLLRWYNWKPYGEQGIKTMLTQKFGVTGREYIPNLIRDLNMQSKAGYTPGIAEGFTKNAKAAAVGANIRVVIQQPTAIARAAVMMNPKYIAQGEAMTPKRMKECGNLAKQYCPIAKWKSMGYYETHMGKGLRDLMFGGQGVLEKASDIGMKPAGWADEATWAALWNACEKETRDMHPELKGEALYEATGKRLGEIIDYTQVVDTPFHRSQLMRSKNSTVQMATAFMSEPTKNYNMLQASIARWAENRRDPVARAQVGRTLLVFVATGVLNAAAQSVIDAMRDDDDEEKLLEKYMQAFGGNVLDNLNAVALLPYASDIISMMQGYEPGRMDMQMVQKVIDVFKELFDGKPSDWSKHKWARKVLSAVSYATGVPLENLYRDATSLYNTVVMQFGGKPLPSQHQTANEKMAYGNLYDALMDGNQKKWSRIEGKIKAWEKPKSNSDIDTGIGKLLAEDDERIARAWEAKSAGKASEVSRIRKEIVTDLAKSGVLGTERLGEIVDKAINTYGSKVTPKEEKPVDTEKTLNVKMYTTKDAANAVRGIADGTTSLADAKAIMSELVADSEAKDPQKSVQSSVLGEVKKDYLEAAKSGNTRMASSLGNAMKELFGTTQTDMDKWVTDSYADDLRTAVDANNVGNAKNIMAKLRARGLDDYDIQDRLSKYRQQYIDAAKSGNSAKANQIKRTLMALGLKYNSGEPMYKDSTFEGWLK